MKDLKTKWLPLAAVVTALWAGGMTGAQAAVCVADNDITKPDAEVTDSVDCGSGTTIESYKDDDVKAVENVTDYNLNWELLEEVEQKSSTGTYLSFTGMTTGNWSLTTDLALNANAFLLVIKDGGVKEGTGQDAVESPKWFWFILDESNPSNFSCGEGVDLCGTWAMYGDDQESGIARKKISHMRIYTAAKEDGTTPPTDVPEPGPLSLLGLGLMGLWFARRKTEA